MASSKLLADYLNDGYSVQEIIETFESVQSQEYAEESKELRDKVKQLFLIGLSNINTMFPKVGVDPTSKNPKDYIKKWLHRYYRAHSKRPSLSSARPKNSANDPALPIIVQETKGYNTQQIEQAVKDHNLFMNAENVQGNLLEEYIDSKAQNNGWIWAEGKTLRACDFCRKSPSVGLPEYVQIKNRDNTENSSSSAIRRGTQITKWYRLKTRHKNKMPYPEFQWDNLNKIMSISNENKMSEEDYDAFLKQVGNKNSHLLD